QVLSTVPSSAPPAADARSRLDRQPHHPTARPTRPTSIAMTTASTGRPALRLITPLEHEAPAPLVAFCSHCGARPAAMPDGIAAGRSRVCESCGLGLILESSADAAPSAGDAFLVLDH